MQMESWQRKSVRMGLSKVYSTKRIISLMFEDSTVADLETFMARYDEARRGTLPLCRIVRVRCCALPPTNISPVSHLIAVIIAWPWIFASSACGPGRGE